MKALKRKKYAAKLDRMTILTMVVFVLALTVVVRLFDLQVLKHGDYQAQASGRHDFSEEIEPKRGSIFVQSKDSASDFNLPGGAKSTLPSANLYPIATNAERQMLYANPSLIGGPAEVAKKLFPLLEISEADLAAKLSRENDSYEILKHYLTEEQAKAISDLKIEGLGFSPETVRYYSEGNLFGQISGFLGYKGDKRVGQYGIEEYFNDILAGEKGMLQAEKDALGRPIVTSERSVQKEKDGADIVLTIDHAVQFTACKELEDGIREYRAESGTVIIMEPQTGKLLALCNYPNFDPNNYSKVDDISLFANPAVSYLYEPGSIFKSITMAAGLDAGKVSPTTTYQNDGFVKIGGYTISNVDQTANGIQTMTNVLEKSLNTGVIFVVQELGAELFKSYVDAFVFGQPTGIELSGEAAGNVSSLVKKGEIYSATASFGNGISVTPLQMAAAYGAIANQGKLMEPHLVDRIVNSDGSVVRTEPKFIRQVVSPSTASSLSAMLVSVIKNGHVKRAGVDGYYVAGKTGTSFIPDRENGGYSDQTIHSFVGFAPADNPKFVVLVKLDKPQNGIYADQTSAPVFNRIAKFMLNYYEIAPEY